MKNLTLRIPIFRFPFPFLYVKYKEISLGYSHKVMGATHLPKTFQDCLPLMDHLLIPHNDPLKIPHQYFTDGSFLKRSESCSVESDSLRLHGLYSPWNSPGQNTGDLSLLQGIFPTQGSNPGPLHCRWILNDLSHQGSQRILEWGAYPFSRGSY